jgi:hypothetical protein
MYRRLEQVLLVCDQLAPEPVPKEMLPYVVVPAIRKARK